jgi:peptidoglycan hydrolase-like protein with peptidoglycan-binding domain
MKKILATVGFFGFFASQTLVSSAAYFTSEPIPTCQTQITTRLALGSENDDVFVLQQMLASAGFLNASPNGYFGYQTRAAVRAFQINNSLSVTGTVNEATRNAVNERLCDTDVIGNSTQYGGYDPYSGYGYSSGVTYVAPYDPYVQVVSPTYTDPAVFATPQTSIATNLSPSVSVNGIVPTVPGPNQAHIIGTSIVNTPGVGYTYALSQSSGGSIAVSSPVANSIYREGDTISVQWSAQALQGPFTVSLENSNSGQNRVVTITPSTSYQLVLTKDLLDAICTGACSDSQQDSFKVVVSVPTTDIAGTVTPLRVAVSPIVIKRPTALGKLTVTVSQSPVDSGTSFRLYINTPNGSLYNLTTVTTNYTIAMRATCPSSFTVNLAGAQCGQDIVIPFDTSRLASGVPVTVTNPTWFKQDVIFDITLRDPVGQVVAVTQATVTANPAPFNW